MKSKNDAQTNPTGSTNIPVSPSTMIATDAEIQKYRRRLSVIFGILITLTVVVFICVIFDNPADISSSKAGKTFTITYGAVLVLAFLLGLYFTRQYHPTCLRAFAWLLIILIVCSLLETIAEVSNTRPFQYKVNSTNISQTNSIPSMDAVEQFLYDIAPLVRISILLVIVTNAFKLAKLIENKRLDALQQA